MREVASVCWLQVCVSRPAPERCATENATRSFKRARPHAAPSVAAGRCHAEVTALGCRPAAEARGEAQQQARDVAPP